MEEPRVETVDAAEIGEALKEPLERITRNKTRVVVEQDGKIVAAGVSPYDYERLLMLDRRVADGWQAIQEIRARNAHLDPDEVECDIAEAIAEMRAEDRARAAASSSPT